MLHCLRRCWGSHSWLLAGFLSGALLASTQEAGAQSCEDPSFNSEGLVHQALQLCNPGLLYEAASTVGERAVPALHELFDAETAPGKTPRCGLTLAKAAGTSLAKLGDENSFQEIAQEFKESGNAHARLQDLALIGDDRALAVMLTFVAAHPRLSSDFRSAQLLVLQAIGEIGQRRRLPDVATTQHHPSVRPGYGPGPPSWTADELLLAWQEWWEAHKGERIAIAPYESVEDPYLRCLARRVDWGFSEAILAIAERGDDQAKAVLEKFPTPVNMGIPSIPGYLFLALAKLEDQEKLREIHDEWDHGSDFTDAIEKLEYIGGRQSVELFVARFDLLAERLESAAKRREQCVAGLVERQKLKPGPAADKYIKDSWCQQNYDHDVNAVQQQRADLLGSLARMVKDPPLSADAKPTPENVLRWQNWWAKNKDTAQFTVETKPGH